MRIEHSAKRIEQRENSKAHSAKGKKQKAEGRRQKAESRKQKIICSVVETLEGILLWLR